MSAGFEFAKKHEITICGRAYPCDISDKRMLEGVTRDFPRVLQAAQGQNGVAGDGQIADRIEQRAVEVEDDKRSFHFFRFMFQPTAATSSDISGETILKMQ